MSRGFGNERLEEKQLDERMKGLKIDLQNIARVIAATAKKTEAEVTNAMSERTTLNPDEAREWGLVHEIRVELFHSGSEFISI